ncbi:hypothetical protein K1T71_005457 [Dendrolimus kikuchii]|uniref:Uncharacterized protein n=1 Tax=Dendrolimus kikuchii TaxID=765133 RepID=A0ACC1D496_9NEOP|nr:hypothetical protein K1T71_005457 [Dendrolimus kikuchii]
MDEKRSTILGVMFLLALSKFVFYGILGINALYCIKVTPCIIVHAFGKIKKYGDSFSKCDENSQHADWIIGWVCNDPCDGNL